MTELEHALSEIKWDVIGICETRRQGYIIEDRGYYRLYLNGDIKGRNGVGFLVKKQSNITVIDFIGITGRAALLIINIYGSKFTLVQTYAPTTSSDEKEMEEFYESLQKVMDHSSSRLIFMGDMNAKIGVPKEYESRVMGEYGYGNRNKRGDKFIDFCFHHNLKIANTMFKKSPKLRWTWMSPDGNTKNEIDYIATNTPRIIENCSVISSLKHPSDHRLVRITLNTENKNQSRAYHSSKPGKHIDIEKYNTELCKGNYVDGKNKSVQEYYDNVEKNILQSCSSSKILHKEIRKQNIITNEIIALKEEKHKLKNQNHKTKQEKNQLSKLYKIIHRKIKYNTKKYRLSIIENYLEKSGAVKKAYKHLKNSKQLMSQLQDDAGITITNRNDLMHIATDFYKKLYSKINCQTQNQLVNYINDELVPNFQENEIYHSLKKLKADKSPGPDGITNEMLSTGKEILVKPLTDLFNLVLSKKEIPKQWTNSHIVLLYKKGDAKMISNYRPISLMSSLYKVFSTTLLRRLTKIIDENQPVEQAGFVKNFSTVDHIHTLKIIIEKYCEYDKPLYLCFIDYSKAFDTISHSSIWHALSVQGVNKEYIDLVQEIYKNSTSQITLEKPGPSFKIERGVKQGDPLSPKLFIAVLEEIFRKLDWDNKGLNLHGKYLSHLRFADDIVLLSEDPKEMQTCIEELGKESRKVGLEVNWDKTKLMTNRKKAPMTILSSNLEYVENYIYLGHLITFKKCTETEIERRTKSTWNKYWAMKEIFKNKLPIKLKTKAMEMCLLPCLTYACQTWALTKKSLDRIRVCQRGIERSYTGHKLKDKIKNSVIREKTKAQDATRKILHLKWKWAGHVQRMAEDRWSKTVTNWHPLDKKRRPGRPRKRWSDDIVKIAGSTWSREARDRTRWRQMEEAFTALGGPYLHIES